MRQQNGYGYSWGMRGFRIGRSSYGNWWVSISLPFGIRFTKRLGKNLLSQTNTTAKKITESHDPVDAPPTTATSNQKILARIKKIKP
jgi:hypothetical protein